MDPAPSEPQASPDALIFQWERRSWSRLRLVPMLALSVLVHAASFYVLQVAYTPTGSQLPPPAQVVLVRLEEPENASLARWLEMSDPTLLSRPAKPALGQTLAALDFHYTPSYAAAAPDFKPLESASANSTLVSTPPRPHPAGPVPANLLPPPAPPGGVPLAAPLPAPQATRIVFSAELAALAPERLPPVRFTATQGTKPLDPTVFLIGVRSAGGAPLVFRQGATGDAEADNYAHDYLAVLSFRPPTASDAGKSDAVVWGWATFYWGSDAYRKAEGRR